MILLGFWVKIRKYFSVIIMINNFLYWKKKFYETIY